MCDCENGERLVENVRRKKNSVEGEREWSRTGIEENANELAGQVSETVRVSHDLTELAVALCVVRLQ